MDKKDFYLQTIQEEYPDFKVQCHRFLSTGGQFSDVLIVNDEYIFRFPRYPEGIESIVREVQILSRIQGLVPLAIPNPIFKSQSGKVFMGYRMIPGEPLRLDLYNSLETDIQQRLATQLAGFSRLLHQITANQLGLNFPVQDSPEEWANFFTEIHQHLFPLMRSEACDRIAHHFDTYLNATDLQRYKPVLRHGDFGTSNILYDRTNKSTSGIIDFGFAGFGDPAIDIAGISWYGEAFMGQFSRAYPETGSMMERARFYRGTFALQEALHGFKTGDREAFENGIASYK